MADLAGFRTVIDLTHTLDDRSPNWEGTEESPFRATELGNIHHDGYYSRIFTTQEHYGTHLDAPAHFCATGWTVEQIPAERLVGPLVVIDVRDKAAQDADYEVSLNDVERWEAEHAAIPAGAVVCGRTGWERLWNAPKQYRNEESDGLTHYPGFSLESAQLLVRDRGIVGLGVDTMSVEKGATTTYPVHIFTSSQNVYHLENLANLGSVPPAGAIVVVAPIKLENGSGGPARVLVLVR
jgi:kynurenine formamidase